MHLMTESFFKELKTELQKGASKKRHPFRYCTFATVGAERVARLRTVVLRKVTDELMLSIYTDKRSTKLQHIKANKMVSMLFYHPKRLLQIKIEGTANIVTEEETLKKYWSGVQPNSRKDYMTKNKPGTLISNPDEVEYLDEANHFCILTIEPFKIEYLKLKRPNHLRVQYNRTEHDWESNFLVP